MPPPGAPEFSMRGALAALRSGDIAREAMDQLRRTLERQLRRCPWVPGEQVTDIVSRWLALAQRGDRVSRLDAAVGDGCFRSDLIRFAQIPEDLDISHGRRRYRRRLRDSLVRVLLPANGFARDGESWRLTHPDAAQAGDQILPCRWEPRAPGAFAVRGAFINADLVNAATTALLLRSPRLLSELTDCLFEWLMPPAPGKVTPIGSIRDDDEAAAIEDRSRGGWSLYELDAAQDAREFLTTWVGLSPAQWMADPTMRLEDAELMRLVLAEELAYGADRHAVANAARRYAPATLSRRRAALREQFAVFVRQRGLTSDEMERLRQAVGEHAAAWRRCGGRP